MARTATAETLASHVYEEIRSDILNGRFEPGQRLKPGELRLRFNVSVSVVREALARLAEQRLVRAEHNQGFQVAPLSESDLRDLTAIRVQVEGYALRTSIERGDFEWEAHVVAAHHILTVTPARDSERPKRSSEAWSRAHREFHRALIQGCDMPILLDICDSLFDASELYRRMSAPFTKGRRDVACEHREIMEATLARDADLAVARLSQHFETTTALLMTGLLGKQPGSSGKAVATKLTVSPRRRKTAS